MISHLFIQTPTLPHSAFPLDKIILHVSHPYFHCDTYISHVPLPLYRTIFHTPWTLILTSLSFWRWSLQCTLKHKRCITHNTAEPQKPTLHIRCHKYLTIRTSVIFAISLFNCTQKILSIKCNFLLPSPFKIILPHIIHCYMPCATATAPTHML